MSNACGLISKSLLQSLLLRKSRQSTGSTMRQAHKSTLYNLQNHVPVLCFYWLAYTNAALAMRLRCLCNRSPKWLCKVYVLPVCRSIREQLLSKDLDSSFLSAEVVSRGSDSSLSCVLECEVDIYRTSAAPCPSACNIQIAKAPCHVFNAQALQTEFR